MPLKTCPECNSTISDLAKVCPSCGKPLMPATQTIEKTAKKWKAVQLIGIVGMLAGIGGCLAKEPDKGVPIFTLCLVVYLTGRICAWWHHG